MPDRPGLAWPSLARARAGPSPEVRVRSMASPGGSGTPQQWPCWSDRRAAAWRRDLGRAVQLAPPDPVRGQDARAVAQRAEHLAADAWERVSGSDAALSQAEPRAGAPSRVDREEAEARAATLVRVREPS